MAITILCLLMITIMGSFWYGVLLSESKIPPYATVKSIYNRYKNHPIIRNIQARSIKRLKPPGKPKGRWKPIPNVSEARGLDADQLESLDQLLSIGYLDGYEKATDLKNVTTYIPSEFYGGLNLCCSGHAEEAVLMDMKGQIIHVWSYNAKDAFPQYAKFEGRGHMAFWRRVHLYDNGDLLAIYDGWGMIKLDKDSNLIWAFPQRAHHDLFVDENGMITTLTREPKVLPRINEQDLILEDFIVVIDPNGEMIKKVSLLKAFESSSYSSFLQRMPESGDIFHTNTVEVLDGSCAHSSPLFKKGNVLVSVLKLDVIAIVDMEQEKVVWALSGQWKAQHQPTLLDNGNILLFDNQGHHGKSKVIEIDPFSQEIVWAYEDGPESSFYSETCGSNQRLPNGNTLITESDSGRAFEVTPENKIVWEYYNPERAGEKNTLIATLFEVVRLDPDFSMTWLN